MAIQMKCPHCGHAYLLKDSLAGKRVTCAQAACRKVFPVPVPSQASVVPPAAPLQPTPSASSLDIEAQALAALADEPPRVAETRLPPSDTIPVTCEYCSFEFTVSRALIGKNTICPECKERFRVPVPKDDTPKDWRQTKDNLPTFAKRDEPKLDGVWDAGGGGVARLDSLKQAGAIGPTQVKQLAPWMRWSIILGSVSLLGLLSFAVVNYFSTRTIAQQENLMQLALDLHTRQLRQAEQEVTDRGLTGKALDEQLARVRATATPRQLLLSLSEGEYLSRQDQPTKALLRYREVRSQMLTWPEPVDRNLLLIELAVLLARLNGTPEEIEAEKRLDWDKVLLKEVRLTVQGLTNDEEPRKLALSRLTQELASRPEAPQRLLMLARIMFPADRHAEVIARVGLDLASLGQKQSASEVAQSLRGSLGKAPIVPKSENVLGLFVALASSVESPPEGIVFPKPASSPLARVGFAEGLAQHGKFEEARKLLGEQLGGEARLRAVLALASTALAKDGSTPDLEQAAKLAEGLTKSAVGPWLCYRGAQLAGQAGKLDLAKQFAQAIPDARLKPWAELECLRGKLRHEGKTTRPSEDWLKLVSSDDAKQPSPAALLARRDWMRWAVALGQISNPLATVRAWENTTDQPLGLAGAALGLQDTLQSR